VVVFRNVEQVSSVSSMVLSIGNFDGVHLGHRRVLKNNVRRARELGIASAVMTFDPHPMLRVNPMLRILTPLPRKLALLEPLGVDLVLVLEFTPEFSRMTARTFAEEILVRRLQVKEVHEGANFRCGWQGKGDIAKLTELGHELGFAVKAYDQMRYQGKPISSSRIRELITQGRLDIATRLLGGVGEWQSLPLEGRFRSEVANDTEINATL